jgi:hypothetical protein
MVWSICIFLQGGSGLLEPTVCHVKSNIPLDTWSYDLFVEVCNLSLLSLINIAGCNGMWQLQIKQTGMWYLGMKIGKSTSKCVLVLATKAFLRSALDGGKWSAYAQTTLPPCVGATNRLNYKYESCCIQFMVVRKDSPYMCRLYNITDSICMYIVMVFNKCAVCGTSQKSMLQVIA